VLPSPEAVAYLSLIWLSQQDKCPCVGVSDARSGRAGAHVTPSSAKQGLMTSCRMRRGVQCHAGGRRPHQRVFKLQSSGAIGLGMIRVCLTKTNKANNNSDMLLIQLFAARS